MDEAQRPIQKGDRVNGDYVLAKIGRMTWIGVRFGLMWKPARTAHGGDLRYFGIK